jgi:hypothetical protein
MKKFYKLIPLLSLAVVVPTVFSLTSCGVTHATTYDLTGQALENKTAVKNLKHGPSLKTLLYGDKGFHKGNYVLFLSSTCAPPINRVLFGNSNTVFGNDSTIGNDSATLTKNNFDSINDFIANHNSKKEDTGFV